MTTTRRSSPRRPEVEVLHRGPTAETVLLVSVGVLCLVGLVMVYSASSVMSVRQTGSSWTIVLRQFGWLLVGLLLAVGASRLRLSTLRERVAGPLYVVAVLALVSLVVPGNPFAVRVLGATRWIGVGALQFQPSELAKPALILWLARLLAVRQRDIGSADLLKPVIVGSTVLAGLVLLGDDLGTTVLLGVIMIVMLFLAGAPLGQVSAVAGGGALAAGGSLFLLEGFRVQRIKAFLDPSSHLETTAYQLTQSQIGFATGGLFGVGPGLSRAKWGFLTQAHTDFILAVIGEELGLVGSLVVIVCFVAFILAGFRIALRTEDLFGRLVAFGVTTWIGVQALINIGVTVGTLPTKGITLPFVSYGGSSMMMSLFGVGMLLAVARAR